MKHRLELYGTLGPSDCDKATLKEMFHYGMTGLRLNLSHRSLPDCRDWLQNLYEVSEELHIVPDLLVDLQGPELRIGELAEPLVLKEGDSVSLTALHIPNLVLDLIKPGQRLLLDDGKIQIETIAGSVLQNLNGSIASGTVSHTLNEAIASGTKSQDSNSSIISGMKPHDLIKTTVSGTDPAGSAESGNGDNVDPSSAVARVLAGGTLLSRKSLAFKDDTVKEALLTLPTLTDKDLENLSLLRQYRVTGVMLPFVRNAKDLMALKKALLDTGNSHVRVFAKIENQAGIDQLPSLLPHCDHVVIARGDLANAVGIVHLPAIQKKIARLCQRTKTPFMVVTQMLASMEQNPVPTRAEVSDIFNAVLDGAASLMLTGETAIGSYPAEAIRILSDVSFEAQRYQKDMRFFNL